jgi:hypothetical protein
VSNKDWDLISYNQAREFDYQFGSKEIIDYVNDANTKPNPNTITTMSISRIFEAIRREPSKNKKIAILEENIDNELLKKVLLYTYDPLRNYYIKKFDTCDIQQPSYAPLDIIFPVLDALSKREYTGEAALDYLEDTYLAVDVFGREIIRNIIDRSQHLAIDEKSINKVWEGLIPSIGYMRCSLTDKLDRIMYPAIIQQKCDGLFLNVVYKDGNIKFFTRNGNEFQLPYLRVELLETLQNNSSFDMVFHGELLVEGLDGEGVESRKIGNGLVNSLIKSEQTFETLRKKFNACQGTPKSQKVATEIREKETEFEDTNKRLQLVLWDAVDYEDWKNGRSELSYNWRFSLLESMSGPHVKIVESKIVNSFEEAQVFYQDQIERGFEGAVLKNLDGEWKNHTSPNQIKMKGEKECELKVFSIQGGTGKYLGGLGSLFCQSSDAKLIVNVGTGLSDAQRGFERVDANDSSKGLKLIEGFDITSYIGNIVSVKFNELITSEGRDYCSMFLPRLVAIRHDKTEADDFEYIQKL